MTLVFSGPIFLLVASVGVLATTLLEGVAQAVSETPFSAVVKPISYTTKEVVENHESVTVVVAEVVTPVRGSLSPTISFVAVLNTDDEFVEVGEEVLLAFCEYDDRLYFAGVGAVFSPTDEVISHAKLQTNGLSDTQTKFGYCM